MDPLKSHTAKLLIGKFHHKNCEKKSMCKSACRRIGICQTSFDSLETCPSHKRSVLAHLGQSGLLFSVWTHLDPNKVQKQTNFLKKMQKPNEIRRKRLFPSQKKKGCSTIPREEKCGRTKVLIWSVSLCRIAFPLDLIKSGRNLITQVKLNIA